MDQFLPATRQIDGVPAWSFAMRAGWVAVQLVITYYIGQVGATFFYQGF